MGNLLKAVTVLNALMTLSVRSMEAATQVSSMIQASTQDGRDLSEDEIAHIRALSDQAVNRWNEVK